VDWPQRETSIARGDMGIGVVRDTWPETVESGSKICSSGWVNWRERVGCGSSGFFELLNSPIVTVI